jgi:hypothetical protein
MYFSTLIRYIFFNIDHSLQAFGRKPGTEVYRLGIKDLKRSLSCFLQEMTKEAHVQEETVLQDMTE